MDQTPTVNIPSVRDKIREEIESVGREFYLSHNIKHYPKIKALGSGTYGDVFLAQYHPSNDRIHTRIHTRNRPNQSPTHLDHSKTRTHSKNTNGKQSHQKHHTHAQRHAQTHKNGNRNVTDITDTTDNKYNQDTNDDDYDNLEYYAVKEVCLLIFHIYCIYINSKHAHTWMHSSHIPL